MQELILNLKETLKKAVQKNKTCCMLFSGGLDTSILVSLNPQIKAISVSLESSGEDIYYSKLMADKFYLEWSHRIVDIDEALNAIPTVIRSLKSFDPAIPNDLVIYFGLKLAKESGVKEIMTGDGADEIFAGYDFIKNMKDVDKYINRMTSSMFFNSNRLGNLFGIKIKQPYLEKELLDFALKIPVKLKIKKEKGNLRGKWILRKAFENVLTGEIAWQSKRPLEYGSGMSNLRQIITSMVSDDEFNKKSKLYQIKFFNKEHLYYYEIYKNEVGEIPGPADNEKTCPGCGAGMKQKSFHCRVCGFVLDWRKG